MQVAADLATPGTKKRPGSSACFVTSYTDRAGWSVVILASVGQRHVSVARLTLASYFFRISGARATGAPDLRLWETTLRLLVLGDLLLEMWRTVPLQAKTDSQVLEPEPGICA